MATSKKSETGPKMGDLPHSTNHNLEEKTRSDVVALLNARLADGIDLANAVKQAHWNVRGLNFIAFHEMLDDLRAVIDDGNDTLAERAVQLGGQALGTTQVVNAETTLPPYPLDIYRMEDHLEALIERVGLVSNAIRDAEDQTDEWGDLSTSDIFIEINRALDKYRWFLEPHRPVK